MPYTETEQDQKLDDLLSKVLAIELYQPTIASNVAAQLAPLTTGVQSLSAQVSALAAQVASFQAQIDGLKTTLNQVSLLIDTELIKLQERVSALE